jgi:tetratricopeptide (TPR) repeat protein
MPGSSTLVEVFYSYAHEDASLRDTLEKHLSLLHRQGVISQWHDRQITAGTNWAQAVDEHLERASVILLLISADFLASDYCYGIEMKRALERHQANEAHVIPILLRWVDWKDAPFAHIQALPTDAKPITAWHNRDEAFTDVAAGIRRVIEDLVLLPASTPQAILPAVWNVPYRRNPFFTGRTDVLRRLRDKLTTVKTAALTQPQAISGLGGIGKTQIALEYAYQYRDAYRFVFWTRAATHETLVSDFVTIADLLHLPEKNEQDQNQVIKAVKEWLTTHNEWLLILDNADDVAMVSDVVPTSSEGHIVLTSRAQAMGSLAQRIDVESMGMTEGTLFLLRRANVINEDAFLDQASEEQLAGAEAIVIEMDFLPLALDQAGAYIDETGCSLSAYLNLYRTHRKELLQRRSQLPTAHPEPVATTWSLSFQKVEQADPAAADLLRLYAFLEPDTIPEELVSEGGTHLSPNLQCVAADLLRLNEAIEELRKFSLVQRNPIAHSLSMHRLVQAVLKDAMAQEIQHQWAERTVRAINAVFPESMKVDTWSRCRRYLPQAQSCAALIEDYALTLDEAARLLNRTASYLRKHALYDLAEPLYQRALHIREQTLGLMHLEVTPLLKNLAGLYSDQGKYVQAESLFLQALCIEEPILGPEDTRVAGTVNNLAGLYLRQGKLTQAEAFYQRALCIFEQTLGPEHLNVATALNNLAALYFKQGKYVQIEPLYQRALLITEEQLGASHPQTAGNLNNMANLYWKQGKYAQAEAFYQRALCIWEQTLGPEHPDVASSLNGLANLYREQGKYTEAEQLYLRALHIREQLLGPKHPAVALTLASLAYLYVKQGEYAQAELLYQRALHIQEQELDPKDLDGVGILSYLADLYYQQDKYAQAEALYLRILHIREQLLGPEHPDLASALNTLANLYFKQDKYAQAEPLYLRAVVIFEQQLGARHPHTLTARNNYLALLQQRSRWSRPFVFDIETLVPLAETISTSYRWLSQRWQHKK